MENSAKELIRSQISRLYLSLGHTGQTGYMTSCCSTLEDKATQNMNCNNRH